MARGKGGPSNYCAPNQANMRPGKGRSGATERVSPGSKLPRTHEARGSSGARKRGKGKIKSSGKPRFTRFSRF